MKAARVPTAASAPDRRSTLMLLAIFVLAALPFLPALRGGFVNYDDLYLLNSAAYRGLGPAQLRWMCTTLYACNYTPLTWLTFGFDFVLWGMNPAGYHLTGLLFHGANAALFSLVALEFLGRGAPSDRDRWAAAAGALFFAAHPLRAESVAWIFERRDVVGGFFFLLTVLFWLRARRGGEPRPRAWRALALAAFVLSLLSKLSGVMLPFALVLLDVYPLRRLPASPRAWATPALRGVWREKVPFFAASLAFAAVGFVAQSRCAAVASLDQAGLGARAAGALVGFFFYLGKTLWPARLSLVYRWAPEALEIPTLVGAAAAAAGAFAAWRSRAARPAILTAFGWYALMLLPALGLVKLGSQVASDRYSYLPCLSWALLLAAALDAPERRAAVRAAVAALLLVLGAATWSQTEVWRDSATLWRHALKLDPLSSVAHQDLADALLAAGRDGEAILYLEEEARLYPQDAPSRARLDEVLARTHTTFRDHARIHNALGVERAERGEFAQALWHFHKALEYDPGAKPVQANIERAQRAETAGYER
jgi:tetratricopeptide (TPR) repeat protein